MFEKEEEKLSSYKSTFDHIDIPLNALDDAIMAGFQKAKSEEKRKPRGRKWIASLSAAAVLLVGFYTSVRLSPAFADYVTAIPGLEKIVDLIRFDKGRMAAVENNYYEQIGVSDEQNGIKFTVDGAIADEKGVVLFYTIKSGKKESNLRLDDVRLKSLDGESLTEYTSSYGSPGDSKMDEYNGKIEYFFQNTFQSKEFQLDVDVKSSAITAKYSVQFKLKKDRAARKSYKINKTVTVEGQKIQFLDATVYPLRAAVHVKMDPNNTKRILNFDDLRLVDENGETWNKIADGVSSTNFSKDEATVYLQSNYFREPRELYLVLDKIQAVDKDEVNIVVDPKSGKILKQPNGDLLSNFRVEGNDLIFKMETKKPFYYFSFSQITNGNGKDIKSPESYQNISEGEGGGMEMGITIPDLKNQPGPLSLELSYYPTWIRGHEKIKVK